MFAPLAITCPEGGTGNDLVAVPNPVIHSCQILDDARDVRRILPKSEILRSGRRMGFSRSWIYDADNPDRLIAVTEGQGVSLGTPPEGLEKMEVEPIEVVDTPDLPPLWKVFGASRRDSGHWILPELRADMASPDAALHIGPQHVVIETAATDAAAGLAGTDRLQVESSHVMFLARGKTGAAYLAHEAQALLVPIGVYGTEQAWSSWLRLRRPTFTMRVGTPFRLAPLNPAQRHARLRADTDEIMCRIAALIPSQYHGYYTDHPRLQEFQVDQA